MTDNTEFVTVWTTVGKEADADALASALVEERLAACAQRWPIRSVYRWKGRVEKDDEILLVAKTRRELADETVAFVKARHGYETPEILVMPVRDGWRPYLDWIATETRDATAL